MYITTFVARGKGEFPIDMLRYDGCYPLDEESSAVIIDSIAGVQGAIVRQVKIAMPHGTKQQREITSRRWASFGWEVLDIAPARRIA